MVHPSDCHERIRFFLVVVMVFVAVFTQTPCSADMTDATGVQSDSSARKTHSLGVDDSRSGISFPTFYKTGLELCTTDKGLPQIFLFSSPTCPHCQWSGDIFDFIVKYYMANGLIEAHHYDVATGDDLLTKEVESQIPAAHLQIKEHGDPKDLVPYFNFSCKYERIGNGYEKENDSAAEGAEMSRVIEALIQLVQQPD